MQDEFGSRWITTYTGKQFHFLNPRLEEIDIVDIAHALSLTCRFTGQCKEFYSVAEHSIRVAEIVQEQYKLHALLHDASEAYLPDLPRPMKASLPEFRTMESTIQRAIWRRFRVNSWLIANPSELAVKEADRILLASEAKDLMANMDGWAPLPEPLTSIIKPLKSDKAEALFLLRFKQCERGFPVGYPNEL